MLGWWEEPIHKPNEIYLIFVFCYFEGMAMPKLEAILKLNLKMIW